VSGTICFVFFSFLPFSILLQTQTDLPNLCCIMRAREYWGWGPGPSTVSTGNCLATIDQPPQVCSLSSLRVILHQRRNGMGPMSQVDGHGALEPPFSPFPTHGVNRNKDSSLCWPSLVSWVVALKNWWLHHPHCALSLSSLGQWKFLVGLSKTQTLRRIFRVLYLRLFAQGIREK
jgi:hypothetical protein